MIALEPDTRRRLIGSARLLYSDKDGERLAALGAIQRMLPVSLADALEAITRPISQPSRGWQKQARFLCCYLGLLNDRERSFVRDMRNRRAAPSAKQADWLNGLVERVEADIAAGRWGL
jgi:hypothetical protein